MQYTLELSLFHALHTDVIVTLLDEVHTADVSLFHVGQTFHAVYTADVLLFHEVNTEEVLHGVHRTVVSLFHAVNAAEVTKFHAVQ